MEGWSGRVKRRKKKREKREKREREEEEEEKEGGEREREGHTETRMSEEALKSKLVKDESN
jgi:hypothetical protein